VVCVCVCEREREVVCERLRVRVRERERATRLCWCVASQLHTTPLLATSSDSITSFAPTLVTDIILCVCVCVIAL
jgi:hypothetical protein